MFHNSSYLKQIISKSKFYPSPPITQFNSPISTLKLVWRKDPNLDQAIENDKQCRICSRVVREVLNEPRQVIPTKYLQKRMGLHFTISTFLSRNPGLFDTYKDRIRPKSDLVEFIKPSRKLILYLELIVMKLFKLLMMSKNKVVSCGKLVEFGFPDDFLVELVPRYSEFFRVVGSPGESFLELVKWNEEYGKSVIEFRAEEESRKMGIKSEIDFYDSEDC